MNTTKARILVAALVVSIGGLQAQMQNVEDIGSVITNESAQRWIENFKARHKDETYGHLYGNPVIGELLEGKGVAGVYIFNGLDGEGKTHLVFKTVNDKGEVINTIPPVDQGALCPPNCPPRPRVAEVGETIAEGRAQQWITNFQETKKDRLFAQLYGKSMLNKVMLQRGAEGLYFANAIDEKGNERFVIAAIKADGYVMWDGIIVDQGQLCPPNCPKQYPVRVVAENRN